MTLEEIAENHGLTPEGVDYALTQYQIVICEITQGMLSKLSYDAKDIIRIAQDRWCETCDLKEQEEAGGWISVKDRLPERKETVIVSLVNELDGHRMKRPQTGYPADDTGDMWFIVPWGEWATDADFKVTHWMHLPEPPEENEDD